MYVAFVHGPLSTSLEGIELFMETVLAAKPWTIEPSLVPIPWREFNMPSELSRGRKIRIGVMWTDNVVTPHPSITRALTQLVKQLKTMDELEVVNWEPYDHKRAWEIIVRPSNLFYSLRAEPADTVLRQAYTGLMGENIQRTS